MRIRNTIRRINADPDQGIWKPILQLEKTYFFWIYKHLKQNISSTGIQNPNTARTKKTFLLNYKVQVNNNGWR